MPPPFSNGEYVQTATSGTQFMNGKQNVVILTNGTKGLKGLKDLAVENHPGWNIVEVDATKEVFGHTMADQGEEGEGGVNREAALDIAAQLKSNAGTAKDTMFIINCKAGKVRSVILSIYLRIAYTNETTEQAYKKVMFQKDPTKPIEERIKNAL